MLFIGDSLSGQLYESWRARCAASRPQLTSAHTTRSRLKTVARIRFGRLREQRYAGGVDEGNRACGAIRCEGTAPQLCAGLCASIAPHNKAAQEWLFNQRQSGYAVCDNGATLYNAMVGRWVLDAGAFRSNDPRAASCEAQVCKPSFPL